MSDVIIFFIGCVVSLLVAGAVGLLLWGAANEPSGNLVPGEGSAAAASPSPEVSATSARAGRPQEQLAGRGA